MSSNGKKNALEDAEDGEEELEPVTVRMEIDYISGYTNHSTQPVESTGTEGEQEEVQATPKADPPKDPVKSNGVQSANSADTSERLDALARERDALRTEVSELRKSLEAIQTKHEDEVSDLQDQLEDSNSGKVHAENQYQELLGRVNTIKSQLGERLKSYAVSHTRAIGGA